MVGGTTIESVIPEAVRVKVRQRQKGKCGKEGVRRPENEAQRLQDRNMDSWRKENPLGDRKGQKWMMRELPTG